MIQAHGDDVAHPNRVRRCIDLLATSGASMLFSDWDDIDDRDAGLLRRDRTVRALDMLDMHTACDGSRTVIGAAMAWRPQSIAGFDHLTTTNAPVAHDRVMAFRAFLVDGVALTTESLFSRRGHEGGWNRRLVDNSTEASRDFGWALHQVSLFTALRADLRSARRQGLLTDVEALPIANRIERNLADALESVVTAYGALSARGMQPMWVDDELLALASQGALADRLRRRARALAPVREAIRSGRRWRASIRARWPK